MNNYLNSFEKFANRNKKMIIKGAGKFMAKIPGCDELVTLGHMTNLRLDIQLDMVDIEGGDTATPIDTLLRKKVIDITAEDAKFDLNMVRLVLGSKLREGVSGLPYEMKVEITNAIDDNGNIKALLAQSVTTGLYVPDVQVYNESKGAFVSTNDFAVSNDEVVFVGGVDEGDKLIVYYPVVSSTLDPDGYVWVLEEKHTIRNGEITLKYPLFGSTTGQVSDKSEHVSVRLIRENKLLKKTSNPNPGDGEFYVDVTNNSIKFNSYLENEDVYVNYKRPEVVDVLAIGSNDYPLTVTVVHDGQFEQKDGSIQGYQIELFACRVKSNFTLDAARQQAATHSVTLTVIDPERPDGKLGVIKRYQIAGPTQVC